MRTMKRSTGLALLMLLAGGCNARSAQQGGADLTEDQLVRAELAFGLRLLRQVHGLEEGGANIFISPLSVASALAMTYNGAAGTTEEAMRATLGLGGSTAGQTSEAYKSLGDRLLKLDPAVEFLPANSMWYREGLDIEPDFLEVNRRYFDAEVAALDFDSPEAAPTINAWVEERTNGLIDQIVEPPIDPFMMLFVINAIYFKGQWATPFQPELTAPRPFTLADGNEKLVAMMTYDSDEPVAHYQGGGVEALELLYGDSAFSMTIVMPEAAGSIGSLVDSLTPEKWGAILGGLRVGRFELYMPKFKLEYERTLNDVLAAMGLGVAFDPREADFSRIRDGSPPLYISEVKHKTYVDV
ncbi:MAG: serpin family protein, partial [Gemmatimonadota bacterium]